MPRLEVGSPEWIAERRTGVFGTDMPKILGVSRYGGPMEVYLEKSGLTAPLIASEAMRWGNILEEPVAAEYAAKTGRTVRRAAGFLRHPVYSFLGANIDRWSLKRGTPKRVLEIKTTGPFGAKDFGEPGSDQVPPDHLLQSMHYLAVTGAEVADLAVLIGGQKHEIYTIERDETLIEAMIDAAAKFWADFEQGIPPEIDGSEGSSLYLAHKYRDTGVERPMTDDLASLATKYAALKAQTKDVADEITLTGNLIRSLMGDARWTEGSGVRVVYSEVAGRRTVNWPELVRVRGIPQELVEEFTAVGAPTRALTVTMKGDI